jgi:hypothetical protein
VRHFFVAKHHRHSDMAAAAMGVGVMRPTAYLLGRKGETAMGSSLLPATFSDAAAVAAAAGGIRTGSSRGG